MSLSLKNWLEAFRLRTLPLAVSSIAMGGFLAASRHVFIWPVFLLSVLTTVLLQILSNLANDYGDTQNGADSIHRIGPLRAVQAGNISKATMKKGIIVFILLSLVSGISLISIGIGFNVQFLLFLLLGLLSIAAAVKYTAGNKPYGYAGFGDIAVFLFFGWIGVAGSFYLHTKTFSADILLPASACGFFSAAVLNINNMRDIRSDELAGKFSIPVRIGIERAKLYHLFLLLAGIVCATSYLVLHNGSIFKYLFLFMLPLFIFNGYKIYKSTSSNMDPFLKQMAITTLLFVVFFGVGLLNM